MTLPASGTIKLSEIISEYQKPGGDSLRDFLRDGVYVFDAAIPTEGTLYMRDFLGTGAQAQLTNSGTIQNQNLYSIYVAAFGTPAGAVNFIYTNNGTIGGTPGNYALTFGEFPAGSTVELVNNGSILGAGGAAGSGVGGNAILATTTSVYTKKIRNNANIWAGGGGGGGGGAGGNGYYYSNHGAAYSGGGYWCDVGPHEACRHYWGSSSCYNSCGSGCGCGSYNSCYDCRTTNYTTGGAGGGGGRGQGFDGSAASGSGGASGGSNAGTGGTGGTGAGYGNTGATGSTGASGNLGSGSGGTAGGAPGKYITGNSVIDWLATGSRLGGVV